MRTCKQVKDIQGKTFGDLKDKLNEALLEGAEIVAVDIQSLTALITVTEYVGEIKKTSHCCSAYYKLIREEEESEISEDQRDDGLLQFESGRRSGLAEGLKSSGLRQTKRSVKVPSVGTRIPVNVFEDPGRRIIQGGERC